MTTTDVPPTEPSNPATQERGKGGPKAAAKRAAKHHTPGAALVPSVSAATQSVADQPRWFWIGVLSGCPSEWIDLAGENFPKINDEFVRNPSKPDERIRVPRTGALIRLTREKFDRMREVLPRTVIRFTDDDSREDLGTGDNVGKTYLRPRRGFLITIPTAEEEKERIANGLPSRAYFPGPRDEPAARYMFAQPCTNQETGNRGEGYPPSLEESGLDWPDQ